MPTANIEKRQYRFKLGFGAGEVCTCKKNYPGDTEIRTTAKVSVA